MTTETTTETTTVDLAVAHHLPRLWRERNAPYRVWVTGTGDRVEYPAATRAAIRALVRIARSSRAFAARDIAAAARESEDSPGHSVRV